MSDTPRTDAVNEGFYHVKQNALFVLSRNLERELNAQRRMWEGLRKRLISTGNYHHIVGFMDNIAKEIQ